VRLYKKDPSRKNLVALIKYIQKTGDLRSIDPTQLTVLEIDKAFKKFGIWENLGEDIAKLAAHTAALLMRYGDSEKEATVKSIELTGQVPDDEIFHQATKEFGVGVKGRQKPQKHWVRQGHHSPGHSSPKKKINDSHNSAMADTGASYYTLDEAIIRLLGRTSTTRELLEGYENVRYTQR
jgi:hypothetical protein